MYKPLKLLHTRAMLRISEISEREAEILNLKLKIHAKIEHF